MNAFRDREEGCLASTLVTHRHEGRLQFQATCKALLQAEHYLTDGKQLLPHLFPFIKTPMLPDIILFAYLFIARGSPGM